MLAFQRRGFPGEGNRLTRHPQCSLSVDYMQEHEETIPKKSLAGYRSAGYNSGMIHQALQLRASEARRIRAAIKRSGKPAAQVAREAGLQRQNLHNVLSGQRAISLPDLKAVGKAVGLRISANIVVAIENAGN